MPSRLLPAPAVLSLSFSRHIVLATPSALCRTSIWYETYCSGYCCTISGVLLWLLLLVLLVVAVAAAVEFGSSRSCYTLAAFSYNLLPYGLPSKPAGGPSLELGLCCFLYLPLCLCVCVCVSASIVYVYRCGRVTRPQLQVAFITTATTNK